MFKRGSVEAPEARAARQKISAMRPEGFLGADQDHTVTNCGIPGEFHPMSTERRNAGLEQIWLGPCDEVCERDFGYAAMHLAIVARRSKLRVRRNRRKQPHGGTS